MRSKVLVFAATAAVFLALDAAWLTVMGARLYRPAIGHLMRPDVDWLAALAFYAVYVAGLVGFGIAPATAARAAAWRGACFGLVAYATFDLTGQAMLRGWPWSLTIVDLCWGTVASAVACTLGYAVARSR